MQAADLGLQIEHLGQPDPIPAPFDDDEDVFFASDGDVIRGPWVFDPELAWE